MNVPKREAAGMPKRDPCHSVVLKSFVILCVDVIITSARRRFDLTRQILKT